jgi:DNA-binding NarL/FixJ family response regulator
VGRGRARRLGELRRRQGRPEDAARLLEQTGASSKGQLCRAWLALERGQARQAVDLLERLLRRLRLDRHLDRAPALELLVHARAARGELEEAAVALEALRTIAQLVATAPLLAGADLAEGVLAAARGNHDHARALLEDAVDRFESSRAPFEAARARLELATSLIALGQTQVAEHEAATARDRLLELGAQVEAERARRILSACGVQLVGGGPLTRREQDVLALVSDGLTNRQIAERLVVSEHTVHRHVTNILRKLDLPSRTAAAAHAVRSGLVGRASG